ncbi:hypothetical protein [Desulfolucanica intricata]|uniref:hypothetical protein n=1 Tax=Desulfolucanica intricata TaxID=1285191 RepID=UPI0008347954|nr:hypothetical protein [Desulfolucanica intricata]
MFRKNYSIIVILSLSLLLVLTVAPAAIATEDICKSKSKLDLKIEKTKELESSGINKMLDKKIQKYYQENNVIDASKLTDLNSPEDKKIIKQIENDMDKFNSRLNKEKTNEDSSIGTLSLGDESPTGTNSISYTAFEDGDMIVVHDGICAYGYYRHAGTYDEDNGKFVSAQKSEQGNGTGVIWEDKDWYRNNYDEAAGYWVPDYDNEIRNEIRNFIIDYLKEQLGDNYAFTSFYNRDSWYCSKLPWVGWKEYYSVDLNGTGGLCLPDDLAFSNETSRFAYSD